MTSVARIFVLIFVVHMPWLAYPVTGSFARNIADGRWQTVWYSMEAGSWGGDFSCADIIRMTSVAFVHLSRASDVSIFHKICKANPCFSESMVRSIIPTLVRGDIEAWHRDQGREELFWRYHHSPWAFGEVGSEPSRVSATGFSLEINGRGAGSHVRIIYFTVEEDVEPGSSVRCALSGDADVRVLKDAIVERVARQGT